jgi:hypothetical protein
MKINNIKSLKGLCKKLGITFLQKNIDSDIVEWVCDYKNNILTIYANNFEESFNTIIRRTLEVLERNKFIYIVNIISDENGTFKKAKIKILKKEI